jgi:glycosyltransferase involved in cell wall biosynthesis
MTRILFIHNTVLWYRVPFFKALSDVYPVKFIFNHSNISKSLYGVETSSEIEGMENVDFEVMANHLGIASGLIRKLWGDYDILVGGNWDSIPEIMESFYYYSVAWVRRKPIILWREDWAWEDTSLKSRLLEPFIKWMVRTSSAIVVPGSKHREYFISLTSEPDKIFLMPNASNLTVHDEDYSRSEEIKSEMDLEDKKIVLYVGRLIKRKGVQYLLRALSEIKSKDVMLLIVGEGEMEDELKIMVKELGLEDNVIFTGNVSQEKLVPYYIMTDLVVVPSITYGIGDPWVLVLNEAMKVKKPVIATEAVGAASDMIKEGENGYIVPEKDVDALRKRIDKILEDNDLAHKMGEESYDIIQKEFRYNNMVEGFQKAVAFSLKSKK